MPPETTLSTFVASDGSNIAVQEWPLESQVHPRGMVLLVHGLGEHAGRYTPLAETLNSWGFAVRGYDQCGHGESDGAPGSLPSDSRMLDDLTDLIDSSRARLAPGVPLIVLGHSMGGLVAARLVSLKLRPIDGLVLSSPALDPGLGAFQKLLLAVLPGLLPNLRVGNGLNPAMLSHDPAVVQAYLADPRVHDRISARLARFIAEAGPATVSAAPQWTVPTLLLYAGADRLVNPAGSRAFAKFAPPHIVQSHCFEALYHEIFNELNAQAVFAALQNWLDHRFP